MIGFYSAGAMGQGGGPGSFVQAIEADSPYLWWRLGEASGTTLADSSGNSRPATLYGTAGVSYDMAMPGLVGDGNSAIEFKASSGYARSNAVLSAATFAANKTFMAVVQINSGAAAGTIIGLHDGGNPTGLTGSRDRVLAVDTAGKLRAAIWSGAESMITSAASINDGNPHILHLAIGADSGEGSELYIDGASVGTIGAVSVDSAGNRYLYVGLLNMSGWTGLGGATIALGRYQDIAVFPTRLSAARILAHAEAGGFA